MADFDLLEIEVRLSLQVLDTHRMHGKYVATMPRQGPVTMLYAASTRLTLVPLIGDGLLRQDA